MEHLTTGLFMSQDGVCVYVAFLFLLKVKMEIHISQAVYLL